jgi:hypothetical protein
MQMISALAAVSSLNVPGAPWGADWLFMPLIVLTVIIHVIGLGLASDWIILLFKGISISRPKLGFTMVIGAITVLATALHALESGIWAFAYCAVNAIPDYKTAMLYSLGAMTTYGHETQLLEAQWRLMGAMEALNGWLLFGLSSAFLFWLVQNLSSKIEPITSPLSTVTCDRT